MKLYLISRTDQVGYDEYDSAVVCAGSEEEARLIHPSRYTEGWNGKEEEYGTWVNADTITVKYLGEATESLSAGVVCASYNAG